MSKTLPFRWLAGMFAILLLVRSWAAATVPLMHQEAYYWMYAQHPSLSYFDHPPMVAWVVGIGTALFGNTEWGVRFVDGMLMIANGWLLYQFARAWWGRTVAWLAVALFECLPVYFALGFLATMDAPLLSFWLIGMIGFTLAVRRNKVWGWYLCGVGLGGALLSKYTGIYLIPGVGLALLMHRPWRKWIASPHPYLAVLLGLALFSPVLVWNARQDWASFRFQFLNRFETGTSHPHPMLEFLGQQVGVATPIVLGAFVILAYRGVRRRRLTAREKVALAFSVPLLLSVMNKAWNYPIHINWTVPAFLSMMPAALSMARVRVRAGVARPAWLWRSGIATPTLVVCTAVNVVLVLFLIFLEPRAQKFRQFGPWQELASHVETIEDDLEKQTGHEPLVIVDGKYELASLMAFYRNRVAPQDLPSQTTVNQFAIGETALGFAYWSRMEQWRGTDCIFVDDDADPTPELAKFFRSVKVVWTGRSNGKTYSIAECRDYLGVSPVARAG